MPEAEDFDYKAGYEALALEVAELKALNARILEQLNYYLQKKFGRKTEQLSDGTVQMSLLELMENEDTDLGIVFPETVTKEAVEEVVRVIIRKKRVGKRDEDLSGLPVERIIVPPISTICPKCDGQMDKIGEEIISVRLERIPPQFVRKEYVAEKFACHNPGCEEGMVVEGKLSEEQQPLIGGSIATPSVVASVVNAKFSAGLPIARQEAEFKRDGVIISRQTLTNWVLLCALMLSCVYEALREVLVALSYIHGDETTTQVVTHDKKNCVVVDKKSYIWGYTSGACEERQVVIYQYGDGRRYKNPLDFLKGFHGTCTADGYDAYKGLLAQGAKISGCWAHMRRKFTDTLKGLGFDLTKLGEVSKDEPALIGLRFCQALYAIEDEAANMSAEERRKYREEKSLPVVDNYFRWIKTLNPAAKTKLHKAVTYAINQEPYLRVFLTDGNVAIDNNRAERAFKSFVVGRKNWLFCQSEQGAKATALWYTIVETAKLNGLNPRLYVEWLLEEHRLGHFAADSSVVDVQRFLPWSPDIPNHIRIVKS